ncbi:MAG TPA: hypothetical protein VIO38_05270 [Rariglobus sp.]
MSDQINLAGAQTVTPPSAPVLEPVAQAGVELAKWVLVIMSGVIVIAVIVLFVGELFLATATPGDTTGVKEYREFWLKWVQMILLNTLLPVLTALLGYVFGSKK